MHYLKCDSFRDYFFLVIISVICFVFTKCNGKVSLFALVLLIQVSYGILKSVGHDTALNIDTFESHPWQAVPYTPRPREHNAAEAVAETYQTALPLNGKFLLYPSGANRRVRRVVLITRFGRFSIKFCDNASTSMNTQDLQPMCITSLNIDKARTVVTAVIKPLLSILKPTLNQT